MKISALLPVHSETDILREVTEKLVTLLSEELHEILIIVSPRSPQRTFEIVAALAREYPRLRWEPQQDNPGLGFAVRQGLAAAKGTHVLMMDSDGEMDVATVPHMVETMRRTQCDMVIASRWIRGGSVVGYDRTKYVLNRAFQLVFRLLYRTHLHDLTLGFKLTSLDKVRCTSWKSQFHDFSMETTLWPIRLGWHIEEVPTTWVRRQSGFSQNPFRRNWLYVMRAMEVLRRRPPHEGVSPSTRACRSEP